MTPDKKIFCSLFFSIFAAVTGVGIVVPLLPVYAKNLGASGFYIAMVFGAFSISRTAALPYFGRLSDRKGRKPFIIAGLFAYFLISLFFLFADTVRGISGLRFIQGIASAVMMPAIQAYVADITPRGKEGRVMGAFHMSMFLGLTAGPLIGGVIHDRLGMDAAFLCMAILSLIGFLMSFFFLPQVRFEPSLKQSGPMVPWKTLIFDREIAGLLAFRFSHTVCIGVVWGFLPVLADLRLSLSSSHIGILIMLGVFISGLFHAPMGYLADRFDKKKMVISGGALMAYGVWSLTYSIDFMDMVVANILFGVGGGVAMPALMAMAVFAGKRAGAMGSVMALMTSAHSLGMMTGAFAAGAIMDAFTLSHAFVLGGATMLLGVFGFGASRFFIKKQSRG